MIGSTVGQYMITAKLGAGRIDDAIAYNIKKLSTGTIRGVELVDWIFRGGPPADCDGEADLNSDGTSANILDLTFLVDRIFCGGAPAGPC